MTYIPMAWRKRTAPSGVLIPARRGALSIESWVPAVPPARTPAPPAMPPPEHVLRKAPPQMIPAPPAMPPPEHVLRKAAPPPPTQNLLNASARASAPSPAAAAVTTKSTTAPETTPAVEDIIPFTPTEELDDVEMEDPTQELQGARASASSTVSAPAAEPVRPRPSSAPEVSLDSVNVFNFPTQNLQAADASDEEDGWGSWDARGLKRGWW